MYSVIIKPTALKVLKKLPKQFAVKVDHIITSLASNPRPHSSKKLQGYENAYRIRYADYRIVYTIYDNELIVEVINIGDRKEIYKNM